MKVQLFGAAGNRTVNVDPNRNRKPVEVVSDDAKAIHRKTMWVNIKLLLVDVDALWACIKAFYGVDAGKDLTARQWAEIAAQVKAATHNLQCRADFLERVGYDHYKGKADVE